MHFEQRNKELEGRRRKYLFESLTKSAYFFFRIFLTEAICSRIKRGQDIYRIWLCSFILVFLVLILLFQWLFGAKIQTGRYVHVLFLPQL